MILFDDDWQPPQPGASHWIGAYRTDYDKRVFEVLCRYFEALESGQVDNIMSSPTFGWDDAKVDEFIATIDEEFDTEVHTNNHLWRDYDAGPGYGRLPQRAKRALCEELERVVSEERK